MAYQSLGLGSSANDGTGDDLRTGGDKINDNFVELYTKLGNGSTLSNLTFPTGTDTIVGRATTDTLTNKTLTSPTITTGIVATSLDMNGGELILDADADTSITADTDDTIHFKIAGNDRITMSTGLIDLKNDGAQSAIRMYCESSNAHYAALTAPAHSDFAGNITITMPSTTDTLVGRATTDTLTNKTLTSPVITTPQINDTSANHQYIFAVSELAADRNVTLPLLGGNDEFVFKDHAVTMTNKTMGAMFGTVQALSGAGAVDITSLITQVTTTGSNQALSLANGANGQLKIVTMVADGGDGILTPTTFANGSTITFNDVGDSAILVYNTTGGWAVVGSTGVTIA